MLEGDLEFGWFWMRVGNWDGVLGKKRRPSDMDRLAKEEERPLFWVEILLVLVVKSLGRVGAGEPTVEGGEGGNGGQKKGYGNC